jgi:hypothetical protein
MMQTAELIAEYRATAIAWDVVQADPYKANPLLTRLHEIFTELRLVPAGRSGIEGLMADETSVVSYMAAIHSLGWTPEKASAVLEAIAAGPGQYAGWAKPMLARFRAGGLDEDW